MYPLLDGLRIVECASFIAAPSCSLHLHQLGAQVIRIDPLGGGPDMHRWPLSPRGDSYYWEGLNKGKLSITIDFSHPQGRELVVQLISTPGPNAGLFVTNFPQDGFLSHTALAQHREDLITLRVMGWNDGEPAVDYTINAALGVPLMTGSMANAQEPVNHVLPAWDLLTGAYSAFCLLAAERHRRSTGQGQEVLIPLSDMAIASMSHMGQIAEVLTGQDRPRMGNDLFGAFGRDFQTADGARVMVVAITPRQWMGLLKALNLLEAVGQLERELQVSFESDEGLRFVHRSALFPLFESAIRRIALSELRRAFEVHHVCWAPYSSLKDTLQQEPRMSATNPMFELLDHPSGARYPAAGAAGTFQGLSRQPMSSAPHLGADTDQILSEVLGMSSAQIGRLRDAGLVGAPNQQS